MEIDSLLGDVNWMNFFSNVNSCNIYLWGSKDELVAKEEEIRKEEAEERAQRIEAYKEKRRLEKLVS